MQDYISQSSNNTQNTTLCRNCGYIHQTNECSVNQTTFQWKNGGENVFITGSWNQWQAYIQMSQIHENKNIFSVTLNLPMGVFEYKYIIDGQWQYDSNKPLVQDGKGSFNNVIEVVPRAIEADQSDSEDDMFSIHESNDTDVCIKLRTNMDAYDMKITGSWDNWKESISMKRKFSHIHNNYLHEVKMHLKPGRYEYKFISQNTFVHDPEQRVVQNEFGNYNNVVFVNENQLKQQNYNMKKLVWTSSKVSNEFQFDQMLIGHSINFVGNEVYIFGGCRGGQYLDNFWSYNVIEQELEHVHYIGQAPSARAFHKTLSFGNKILFYGGLDNNRILTDYYVFNTTTKNWQTSQPVGQRPGPRERYTISMYKKFAAILFGGYYCSQDLEAEIHYNQIFSLNLQKMLWTELKPEGKLPEPRFAHTSNSFKQYIVIFGGLNQHIKETIFNDCWKIGLENQNLQWEKVSDLAVGTPPLPRYSHSATIINEFLVIFGGRTCKKETLNDVHVLDLIKNEWIQPEITGEIPKPRLNHAACQLYKKDGVIIFGGNLIFNKHKNLDLTHGFLFYYLRPEKTDTKPIKKLKQIQQDKDKNQKNINSQQNNINYNMYKIQNNQNQVETKERTQSFNQEEELLDQVNQYNEYIINNNNKKTNFYQRNLAYKHPKKFSN